MAVVMGSTEGHKGDDRDPNAAMVAGLVREGEMAQANPRITEQERSTRLDAIRQQVEHYGGDPALVPAASKPAAAKRSTRNSKAADARSKRGGSKADD